MNFKISKGGFYCVLALIVLLPILLKLKLILLGQRTEAVVIGNEWVYTKSHRPSKSKSLYSIITFSTPTRSVQAYGPENLKYEVGDRVKVIYDKNNPSNNRCLNIYHFYAGLEAGVAAFLLLIWIGIYRTFG